MKLAKSIDLFDESGFPIKVNTEAERPLHLREFHGHEYYEILFVKKGSLISRFKGCDIQIKSGDVLIMNPDVLHLLEDSAKEKPHQAFFCSFLPHAVDTGIESLKELKDSNSPNRYFFKSFTSLTEGGVAAVLLSVEPQKREGLTKLFKQLRETSYGRCERDRALTRHYFLLLLVFLSEQYERAANRNTIKVEMTEPLPV